MEVNPAVALDEARERGVLVRHGARYGFRHPLLRSAVLELATADQQLAAHTALAAALPVGDRARVWHQAESTIGADAQVAEQLARLADADRHRLGYAAASAALERACDLTPDPDLAAQRLALAAHDAFLAGTLRGSGLWWTGAHRYCNRPRPRRGAVHPGDAGAVRRLGPSVGRAPRRCFGPARRSCARTGADGAGDSPASVSTTLPG